MTNFVLCRLKCDKLCDFLIGSSYSKECLIGKPLDDRLELSFDRLLFESFDYLCEQRLYYHKDYRNVKAPKYKDLEFSGYKDGIVSAPLFRSSFVPLLLSVSINRYGSSK